MNKIAAFPKARTLNLRGGGWLSFREQTGQGPTVVLLHGFTDQAESFRLIAPHLAGRHLVMPDFRGHGGSVRDNLAGLSTFVSDIEDMAEVMGLTDTVLVGHSMGALVAISLASGRLKPKGLVVISGSLQPASPELTRIAARFAALSLPLQTDNPFLDEWYACCNAVPRQFLDSLRSTCAAMRQQDWASCLAILANADLRDLAQRVEVPTLVVAGDLDPIFSADHRDNLRQNLRPCAELVLHDVGHNPHWEAPKEVAKAINAFLDRCLNVS